MTDKKWEYSFKVCGVGLVLDVEKLNEMGQEGWEVISLMKEDSTFKVLFKREIGVNK